MLTAKNRTKFVYCLFILSILLSLCACAKPEQPTVEAPPELTQPILPPAEPPHIDEKVVLPPAKLTEVQDVIKRIYGDALVIDTKQILVGDFNGDGSQDIAVVAKPVAGKLEVLNNEVANWILEDPQKIPLPDPTKSTQQFPPAPPPVNVELRDTLLALLHGYGQDGWRSPQAIQTYLLKNAVGKNMLRQTAKDYVQEIKSAKNLPRLQGDIIKETLDSQAGFLYYTGAKYVWHPAQ